MLEHPHSSVSMITIFLDNLRGLNIYDQNCSMTLDNASNYGKIVETIFRHVKLQFPMIFHF